MLDGVPEAMTRVLRSLESCSPRMASEKDFQRTMTVYQNVIPVQVLDATYDDMVASGMLAELDDEALRGAIGEFYTILHNAETLVQGIRSSVSTVDGIVCRRVALSYDDEGAPVLSEFDFDEMCGDVEFRNAVVEMLDMQLD